MKYFVTGGAGFIGSNLCDFLVKNTDADITVYDNLSVGKLSHISSHIDRGRIQFIEADLLDFETLKNHMKSHDVVIHLAANADIALSATNTYIDVKQTILVTYNVLEAMRLNSVQRLVYSSGSGVYGDLGDFAPDEKFGPMYPVSLYGATKLSAEALISAFSSLFSIKASVFRFANVVGGNQTHGVAYDFIRKLNSDNKKLEVLGNGMQSKSYIHVDDIISAIFFVLKNQSALIDTFNVGTGDYITVREIASIVIEEMGLENVEVIFGDTEYGWKGDVPKVRFLSNKILQVGWRLTLNSGQAIQRSVKQMLEK